MKKLSLLVALFSLVMLGKAQSVIPFPNDSAAITGEATDAFEPVPIHLYVINNTAQTQTFTWQLTDYNITASGWGVQLCDNNNCYDMVINPGPYTSLDVNAYDTMDMKFQFVTYCVAGSGNANVVVYLTGDSANTAVKLNYKADITVNCTTGITEVAKNNLAVYPNPAQNTITLSGFEAAGEVTVNIYDLSGKLIQTDYKNVTAGTAATTVNQLQAGAYMVKVLNKNSQVIGTSRFNKVD